MKSQLKTQTQLYAFYGYVLVIPLGLLDFDIVNFPFLDGDVPRRPSYGVHISQLIRFARASSHVRDFNCRYKFLYAIGIITTQSIFQMLP